VQEMRAVGPVCWGSRQMAATLSWCGTPRQRAQLVVSMETTAKCIIQLWVKIHDYWQRACIEEAMIFLLGGVWWLMRPGLRSLFWCCWLGTQRFSDTTSRGRMPNITGQPIFTWKVLLKQKLWVKVKHFISCVNIGLHIGLHHWSND